MKKIAIVTRKMVMGGIEKVLIEMITTLLDEEYEIDLYVMAKGGELQDKLPSKVNLINIYGSENSIFEKIKNRIKKQNFLDAIKIIFYSIIALKFSKYGYEQEKWLGKMIEKPIKEYDIAIAYHVPASFPVVFVNDYLNAKTKIGWIHSDMSLFKYSMSNYDEYYNKFDRVYCISEDIKNKFLEVYPNLKNKVDIFYNLVNEKKIIELSNERGFVDEKFKGKRLLTVGRLCEHKNQLIIPEVLKRLLNDGYDIRWYLVGEGEKRTVLEKKIEEKNLEEKLILLGNKNNPYPYFKECDIYIQPSTFEGYCTTITEAKLFNNPIVATNFASINEQIENRVTGIITEKNIDSLYYAVKELLDNKSLRDKISRNLNKQKFNKKNKKKIYFEN